MWGIELLGKDKGRWLHSLCGGSPTGWVLQPWAQLVWSVCPALAPGTVPGVALIYMPLLIRLCVSLSHTTVFHDLSLPPSLSLFLPLCLSISVCPSLYLSLSLSHIHSHTQNQTFEPGTLMHTFTFTSPSSVPLSPSLIAQ